MSQSAASKRSSFAAGLSDVLVYVRVDAEIAPYLDDDAEFWVVRPDVSVRGITGLDTVLGGVYIEGNWDTEADVAQLSFVGVENRRMTRAGQRGTSLRCAPAMAVRCQQVRRSCTRASRSGIWKRQSCRSMAAT